MTDQDQTGMPKMTVFARADVKHTEDGFLGKEKGLVAVTLPVETIQRNLAEFLGSLDQILPDATEARKGFGLESFEVSVSIDATGKVGFLGTGAELGGSATLKLSFKRG